MLTVISPAKTLDFATKPATRRASQPQFLTRAAALVEDVRALNPDAIGALMGVSDNIAKLNHRRFRDWRPPFTPENAKQALFAFRGDVYVGLQADSLSAPQRNFAQRHLRILSGLYGLLRPLDLIQPYRLEMGLPLVNRGGRNLYEFWGDSIATALDTELRKSGSNVLVNLASQEYFRAVQLRLLNAEVITPVFMERKGDTYKIISFFAKRARGQMARFIIDHALNEPNGMKKFNAEGYRYNEARSSARELVFTRDKPPTV